VIDLAEVLVDSNILLDIFTEDKNWFDWSSGTLSEIANESVLFINPIIYAEISVRFETIEELEEAIPKEIIRRQALPWEAGFLAGKCFLKYRESGGTRHSLLPDFYIGAHAAIRKMSLLTRDKNRYLTYFPKLEIIAP
jgi:predicted nucleic acid-binding protein